MLESLVEIPCNESERREIVINHTHINIFHGRNDHCALISLVGYTCEWCEQVLTMNDHSLTSPLFVSYALQELNMQRKPMSHNVAPAFPICGIR